MSTVVVKNGNVEFALRNLKQKNAKDGLLKAARERNEVIWNLVLREEKLRKKLLEIVIKEKEEKDITSRTYMVLFLKGWILWEKEF